MNKRPNTTNPRTFKIMSSKDGLGIVKPENGKKSIIVRLNSSDKGIERHN